MASRPNWGYVISIVSALPSLFVAYKQVKNDEVYEIIRNMDEREIISVNQFTRILDSRLKEFESKVEKMTQTSKNS